MSNNLNPEKLSVTFRGNVTPINPVIPRRYTLLHSDTTGELFLEIGTKYAKDKFTEFRDEVIGEWIKKEDKYIFNIYLMVDGTGKHKNPAKRNEIFRRELPLALEAIRYGDSEFFNKHRELDNASIIVYFMSMYCQYHRIEDWGTFLNYVIK